MDMCIILMFHLVLPLALGARGVPCHQGDEDGLQHGEGREGASQGMVEGEAPHGGGDGMEEEGRGEGVVEGARRRARKSKIFFT